MNFLIEGLKAIVHNLPMTYSLMKNFPITIPLFIYGVVDSWLCLTNQKTFFERVFFGGMN